MRVTQVFAVNLALVLLSQTVLCQQRETPKAQNVPLRSFLSAGYMKPFLSDIDDVFRTIERNYRSPQGKDFTTLYYFSVGLQYALQNQHNLRGELFGTVWKATNDESTNYFSFFDLAATYVYEVSVSSLDIYGGAGLGYMWVNAQRTYSTLKGTATLGTELAEIHGILGVRYNLAQNAAIGLEGRYMLADTMTPKDPAREVSIQSITGGIVISFGIN